MQLAREIFSTKSLLVIIAFLFFNISCKKEPRPLPKITAHLSQELKDYFVNYSPGMCWVYKDSAGRSGPDTVELTSIIGGNLSADGATTAQEGYVMNYTSNHTVSFWIWVLASSDSSGGATLFPSVSGGSCEADYSNNKWSPSFSDSTSLESGKIYHNVVRMDNYCSYFSNVRIAKDSGIIAFGGFKNQNEGGNFYLVSRFKK